MRIRQERESWLRSVHFHHGLIVSMLCAFTMVARAGSPSEEDLTAFSLEQLINMDVYSASKFTQKVSEAPSAVTIITAAEIKAYGHRKLIDVLRSVRGIYGRYDRSYDFVGVRGFSRPGDYNSRFLLLVDGYRINDGVYDTATVGSEFILDVDLIDRVEFVPGPGSSIYGSNAFFGVVNVITRRPSDIKGFETSVETASYHTQKARLTYGGELDNGLRLMLSGSYYDSKGRDLYFSEFDAPATNGGIAQNLDYDRYASFFAKLSFDAFTLTTAYSKRKKGLPTGSLGTIFNDPGSFTRDRQTFVDLSYSRPYGEKLDVFARVFYGDYPYDGDYPYFDAGTGSVITNKDGSRSRWWGSELKFVGAWFDKHKLVFGAEYRNNLRQDQFNYDDEPRVVYADDHQRSIRHGVYLQDEYAFRDNLIINAGVRRDHVDSSRDITSPRLGLIYKPAPSNAIKLLYGTAFRAPNIYELYYTQPNISKANPDLKPEKITTYELIFEKYYGNDLRVMAGAFRYRTRDLINQAVDPADGLLVFDNLATVTAKGVEAEIERRWPGGAQIRASLTRQETKDTQTGLTLSNSPKVLAKFNGMAPLFNTGVQGGLEVQYTDERIATLGKVGGYPIANLTLLKTSSSKKMEFSATVYNLFDKKYADPAGDDMAVIGVDALVQDGRHCRLKLVYRF